MSLLRGLKLLRNNKKALDLSLVIPAHNESTVIEKNTEQTVRYLSKNFKGSFQIIIANSGSTDGTWEKAKQLENKFKQVKALNIKIKGRGLALRKAWKTYPAKILIYMDADLSVKPNMLPRVIRPLLQKKADIVIGSRLIDGAKVKRSLLREFTSRTYSIVARLLLHSNIKDYQCGFKAIRGDFADKILSKVKDNNWVFDTELVIKAQDMGMKVLEVPVIWKESERSSVDIISAATRFFRGINRIAKERKQKITLERILIFAILALATVLFTYKVTNNSWANTYYSMAIQSASTSWKAFIFGGLDGLNFVTIDKLPVSIWPSATLVKLFGLKPLWIILPHIVAGVLSTWLIYKIVKRSFGVLAGFFAALIFCLTPIVVVIFRYNQPDTYLVLFCLAATYYFLKSLDNGKSKDIVLSFLFLGLGFNVKMAQAMPLVLIFTILYLHRARLDKSRALALLLFSGLALIVVSSWWFLMMTLIPAQSRPFIGSTTSNGAKELILNYTGMNRLNGAMDMPSIKSVGTAFGGKPGIGRLFSQGFAQNISWLLLFAFVAGIASIWLYRYKRSELNQLVVWYAWLMIFALLFSFARGVIHPYYVVIMAPALAALCGISLATVFNRLINCRPDLYANFVILCLALTGIIISPAVAGSNTLIPSLLWQASTGFGLLAVIFLFLFFSKKSIKFAQTAFILAVISALFIPATLSVKSANAKQVGFIPTSEPIPKKYSSIKSPELNFPFKAAKILSENYSGKGWVAATINSFDGAPIQLATNKPVLVLGGFGGKDNIISINKMKELIHQQKVRYFVINRKQTVNNHSCPDYAPRKKAKIQNREGARNESINSVPNTQDISNESRRRAQKNCAYESKLDMPSVAFVASWIENNFQPIYTDRDGWVIYDLQ